MELKFSNLAVYDKEARVLENVNCSVQTWNILCVLGFNVSKKSDLLSTLAGRGQAYEGQITINGRDATYAELRHNVGFVSSNDRFLPTLTVKETLTYAGMLRRSPPMTATEIHDVTDTVERIAGLKHVAHTPVQFANPLARKCLNIACELLYRKHLLAIVEPFEGLTLRDSLSLMSTIRDICNHLKTGVVFSTSSPSGHVIKSCDTLLCLHQGEVVYNCSPERLEACLTSAGFMCPKLQNPAEYLMSVLDDTSGEQSLKVRKLIDIAKQHEINDIRSDTTRFTFAEVNGNGHVIRETALIGESTDVSALQSDVNVTLEQTTLLNKVNHKIGNQPAMRTSFWYQTWLLTRRNFRNARRRVLFPISVLQNIYILVVCTLVWWRPHRGEESVKDRMGLFFFTTVQWAFFALLDAVLTFPKEMMVVQQEQRYGLYRLSAFCVAKTLSELPLVVLQPSAYMIVIYWVANLRGILHFIGFLGVLAADVIAAQSVGLLIGSALNPPWTISIMSLGLLSMMLWGGAFCTPPTWLRWGKYASYFTYGLNAFIALEFQDGDPIRCAENTMVPMCNAFNPDTNSTVTHFPSDAVLLAQQITWPVWSYVTVLIFVAIITRLLWYICLKKKC